MAVLGSASLWPSSPSIAPEQSGDGRYEIEGDELAPAPKAKARARACHGMSWGEAQRMLEFQGHCGMKRDMLECLGCSGMR